jgi:hypothetical protein
LKILKPKRSLPDVLISTKRQSAREFLNLQRLMAGAVMRPLSRNGGMQSRAGNGRPMKTVAASFIKPNDRLTSFERLEIYNRQYWFRLRDCFYDDYPGLRAVLGDRRFERMADAYLERHPSECFTLRNLGRRLLGFLKNEPRWIAPNGALALDMARLEWAHIDAFDNEAQPPVEMTSLAGKDPGRIRLRLQPHITLLHLGHEVDEFLIKIKQGERLRDEVSNAMEMRRARLRNRLRRKLRRTTVYLAVHRYKDAVYYKRLDAAQFCMLSAFQKNASIAEACEELALTGTVTGDIGTKVKSWFETWASLGWFCR